MKGSCRPPVSASTAESALATPGAAYRTLELGQGTWQFTAIGQNTSDPVEGTFTGILYQHYPGTLQ